MSDLLISYSRKDQTFVRKLHAALTEAGRDVWVDFEDVPPTAEWLAEIEHNIAAANAFVFVISPDSLVSKVCAQELAIATRLNKRLVPLLYREPGDIPVLEALGKINWIFTREQDDFTAFLSSLQAALDTDLDYVRQHTRLLLRAAEWEVGQSSTLGGKELARAEAFLIEGADKEPHPTQAQIIYIQASRQAETRRQRRSLAAVSLALVITAILAGVAFWQYNLATDREQQRATQQAVAEHQAGLNESGRLAALAQLEINDHRAEAAVQLALYALQNLPYTSQAEQALAQAVQASRLLGRLQEVQSARWSPDGSSWAVVSMDNAVAVLDVGTHQERWRVPFASRVISLRWSPDGGRLLVQEIDGVGALLSAADGRLRLTHDGPPLPEFAWITAEWAPDGRRIAAILDNQSSGAGSAVQIWDSDNGETVLTLRVDPEALPQNLREVYNNHIGDLAWSPDGSQIVVVHPFYGCCGMISVWDARVGTLLQAFDAPPYASVAWSPDGRWVATSGAFHGGSPDVWDAQTWTSSKLPVDRFIRAGDVAWSPDGSYLAAVSQDEDALWVWDTEQLALVLQVTGDYDQVDWAPDGDRLLAHEKGSASAALLSLYPAPYRLELDGGQIGAWSPDGRLVLNASPARVHHIAAALANPVVQPSAIDLPFLDEILGFGVQARPAWLADGRLALTTGFNSELWDLELGTRLPLDESLAGSAVSWSPSGTQYAIARWEGHQVYGAQGKLRFTLPPVAQREVMYGDLSFVQIAWNPAETQLATSDGSLVRLWDAANGGSLGVLEGGQFPVSSLSWSPDGSRLATATGVVFIAATGYSALGENVVRVWDVASRQEVYRLGSPQDGVVNLVAWSPDGQYLLTGNPIPGQDRLRIWRAWTSLEDLLAFAQACCTAAPLTAEQRKQFRIP